MLKINQTRHKPVQRGTPVHAAFPKYRLYLSKEAKKLARETEPKVKKRKKKSSVAGKRKVKHKVGRPKLIPQVETGIQSIASFFRRL